MIMRFVGRSMWSQAASAAVIGRRASMAPTLPKRETAANRERPPLDAGFYRVSGPVWVQSSLTAGADTYPAFAHREAAAKEPLAHHPAAVAARSGFGDFARLERKRGLEPVAAH